MRRRTFLQVSATAGLGVLTAAAARAEDHPAADTAKAQIYEIRTYHFKTAAKRDAYAQFAKDAMVPALNRVGVQPVGVFMRADETLPDATDLWMLLPHESLQSVIDLEPRLAADEAYQTAGKEILSAGKADPAFTRFDTELLYAFAGHPRLTPPAMGPERILEMRQYENPSMERALNKMKMFNSGEIPIFDRCGMRGVFFGEAIAGPNLPQLTYMICHENQAAAKRDWSAFGKDPDWHKLNTDPVYKDNVSNIVSRMLKPATASQI